MRALSDSAPRQGAYRIYFIGGATAVDLGWRESTLDADISTDDDRVLGEIQALKETLQLNVELVRPEDFVPALSGSSNRHLFIDTIGRVSYYHYDPYSQLFSKLVRGFRQDILDARRLLSEGLVEAKKFRSLVAGIPEAEYARHPNLSRKAVGDAIDEFMTQA